MERWWMSGRRWSGGIRKGMTELTTKLVEWWSFKSEEDKAWWKEIARISSLARDEKTQKRARKGLRNLGCRL